MELSSEPGPQLVRWVWAEEASECDCIRILGWILVTAVGADVNPGEDPGWARMLT